MIFSKPIEKEYSLTCMKSSDYSSQKCQPPFTIGYVVRYWLLSIPRRTDSRRHLITVWGDHAAALLDRWFQ